ncbi:MAG: hypothetical protein PHQ59_03210 [Candidatus Daviesbacteria bacterium]|nr:hypothetical protein [Candidatus Daviesbacteria bacterium]
MIEVWEQKGRKPTVVSSEAFPCEVENISSEFLGFAAEAEATRGIVAFLTTLQEIEGVEGVAFSLITEHLAPRAWNSVVKVPFYDQASERTLKTYRAIKEANAELGKKLDPVMPSGLRINKSTDFTPRSFVTALRRRCGRSKTEELIGVFLFKK